MGFPPYKDPTEHEFNQALHRAMADSILTFGDMPGDIDDMNLRLAPFDVTFKSSWNQTRTAK